MCSCCITIAWTVQVKLSSIIFQYSAKPFRVRTSWSFGSGPQSRCDNCPFLDGALHSSAVLARSPTNGCQGKWCPVCASLAVPYSYWHSCCFAAAERSRDDHPAVKENIPSGLLPSPFIFQLFDLVFFKMRSGNNSSSSCFFTLK